MRDVRLSGQQWQRIKALFTEACERAPGEREAFVRSSEPDPDVAGAVLALLAHDNEALISPLAARVASLEPGEHFGPYQVVRMIGQGGMGVIYQAERSGGQFEQTVAIKLLRPAGAGAQVLVDAMREQRLLARLDHPNIARIIDAGIADNGQSFIVMEYVNGRDLVAYCRELNLDLESRLALFLKICKAVSHAHRNLVLHRDLKPQNILVTEDGEPRLVDFGVARLLEQTGGTTEPSTATIAGFTALTPEYASPEQIRGEPLTTATDVYALGVNLYELLTGERPYRFESRSPEEIVRRVTEAPLDLASKRASSSQAPPVSARLLRGDLDVIISQAMHRDPERRYPSAQALADDVELFMRGLPISARADSVGYRLRKFVRRQRLPVSIAALALLLVIGGLSVAWVNSQARLQEAERAESLNRFMLRLFDSVTPTERQGEAFSVSQLLENGTQRAQVELANEPEVMQQVLLKIVDTQIALGDLNAAQETLDLLLAEPGLHLENSVNGVDAMHRMAWLQFLRGEAKEAIQGLERAATLLAQLSPSDSARLASLKTRQAQAQRAMVQLPQAESLLLEALDLLAGPPALDPREAQVELALVYTELGQLNKALEMHLAVIESSRHWDGGQDSMALSQYHSSAGFSYFQLGDMEAALRYNTQALEIAGRLAGEEHLNYLSLLVRNASFLHFNERLDEALVAAEQAMAGLAEKHPDSSEYRWAMGIRADVLKSLGRTGESVEGFTQLMEEWQRSEDSSYRQRGLATAGLSLASAQYMHGAFEDSLRTIRQSQETLENSGSRDQSRYFLDVNLRMQAHEVQALVTLGRFESAVNVAEEALAMLGEVDEGGAIQLQARFILAMWHGAALEKLGRSDEAELHYQTANEIEEMVEPGVIAGERDILDAYLETGNPLAAEETPPGQAESD